MAPKKSVLLLGNRRIHNLFCVFNDVFINDVGVNGGVPKFAPRPTGPGGLTHSSNFEIHTARPSVKLTNKLSLAGYIGYEIAVNLIRTNR